METKYYIRYNIAGFTINGNPKTFEAGPYDYTEVFIQKNDIAGYEGVNAVEIITDEGQPI